MSFIYQQSRTIEDKHAQGVLCLDFSPDGTYLASGHNSSLVVWCSNTGKALHCVNTGTRILTLTWSTLLGRSVIICGSQNGQIISIWLKKDCLSAMGFVAHKTPLECLTTVIRSDTKNHTQIVSGSRHEVFIWNQCLPPDSTHLKWTMKSQLPPPRPTIFSHDNPVLVTSLQWGCIKNTKALVVSYLYHGVIAYDCSNFTTIWSIPSVLCADAALSPDGHFIAISNVVYGFDLYHASTVQLEQKLRSSGIPRENTDRAVPVRFIQNGAAILGGSCSGRLKIWESKTGKTVQKIIHEGVVQAIAIHSDSVNGSLIATGNSTFGSTTPIILWKEKTNCLKSENLSVPYGLRLLDLLRTLFWTSVYVTLTVAMFLFWKNPKKWL